MTGTVLHGWGWIAARLFGEGDPTFRLNAMYIEFENVASPGDPAAVPDVDPAAGREYYEALGGGRDYLRVKTRGRPDVTTEAGFEAAMSAIGDEAGNVLTFYAETAGTVGLNGLPFSDGDNSVVVGVALVAAPDWADRTQDVVFARGYYDVADQVPKEAGRQVGVSWTQPFGAL